MIKIIRAATLGTSLNTFCEGILNDLKKGVLGAPVEVLAIASPDQDLEILAEREGIRSMGVPMQRHISPIKDLIALVKLYRIFLAEKPDIVHSMTPKAGLLCMIAAWLARVPVRVHTFTGLVWPTASGVKRKVLMFTDMVTCSCATRVVPEGYGVLNDLRDFRITDKPIKVLGFGNVMGVDLMHFSRQDRIINLSQKIQKADYFTFLFVGRIVGDKGINELVSAFHRILCQKKRENLFCRMVLVGRFEDRLDPISEETRNLIDATEEIETIGPQYGDDLLAWYAAADCFVFPSYREGFPNTVLEAGAMELASIVTDINGSREIILLENALKSVPLCSESLHLAPGETMSIRQNGVVIPSKNADALYDAMLWMIEHDEERQKMGKRARQIVEERWEQGFVREKLYEFYQDVMKN